MWPCADTLDFLLCGPPSLYPVMSALLAVLTEKADILLWVVGTAIGIPFAAGFLEPLL